MNSGLLRIATLDSFRHHCSGEFLDVLSTDDNVVQNTGGIESG